jgi:hypothetical protein
MIQTPEGDTIEGTDGDWERLQSRSWETDFRQPSFEDPKCLLYTGHSQIAKGGHSPMQTTVFASPQTHFEPRIRIYQFGIFGSPYQTLERT